MIGNTLVTIHAIARDQRARELLPTELWVLIFRLLRYPGTDNFEQAAKNIFATALPKLCK
jgi:hypothetical protein